MVSPAGILALFTVIIAISSFFAVLTTEEEV